MYKSIQASAGKARPSPTQQSSTKGFGSSSGLRPSGTYSLTSSTSALKKGGFGLKKSTQHLKSPSGPGSVLSPSAGFKPGQSTRQLIVPNQSAIKVPVGPKKKMNAMQMHQQSANKKPQSINKVYESSSKSLTKSSIGMKFGESANSYTTPS